MFDSAIKVVRIIFIIYNRYRLLLSLLLCNPESLVCVLLFIHQVLLEKYHSVFRSFCKTRATQRVIALTTLFLFSLFFSFSLCVSLYRYRFDTTNKVINIRQTHCAVVAHNRPLLLFSLLVLLYLLILLLLLLIFFFF
jgi:hypothetical protein